MSESNGASADGQRFVVSRVLVCDGNEICKIPMMAFDTEQEASEFAEAQAQWLQSIPLPVKQMFKKLGIQQVRINVLRIRTPSGQRRVSIAPASALTGLGKPMPKILKS